MSRVTRDASVKRLAADRSASPGEIQAALSEYSRSSCRELSAQVLVLPRELRDIIYEQLWNGPFPTGIWGMLWHGSERTWGSECRGPPCTCLNGLPHFVDLNYMGHQVALEVLQAFKKVSADYLVDYRVSAVELQHFARTDVFHVGLTREEVFRGLDLTVMLGGFIYGDNDTYDCVKHIVEQDLARTVQTLLSIPLEKERLITFNITHGHEHAVNLCGTLAALSPAFHGMRRKGFDIRLQYTNEELDIDWTLESGAWGWSVEEWKINMRKMGDLNVDVETAMLPPYLMEEEFAKQEPAWDSIARVLYRVDLDADSVA